MKRFGMLTSGGDCQALNATMRGVAKGLETLFGNVEIYGFLDGYKGLIYGNYKKMKPMDFSGILSKGGTILGTSRVPFKELDNPTEDGVDKVPAMIKTYKKLELDCLIVLGGNGSQKTANRLYQEGLNVIGLPKTIDNDIWGTDMTFGFYSAVDVATHAIDCIYTTAESHNRVFVIETMGHKVGWITLYAGVAGGADVILLPEIPYDIKKIGKFLKEKRDKGQKYFIIACSEGALDLEEAKLSKKEYKAARAGMSQSIGFRVAKEIEAETGFETRTSVLGYLQRGGSPDAHDMLLATKLGSAAADFLAEKRFGNLIGIRDGRVAGIPLSSIIDRIKPIPLDDDMLAAGRSLGICFGD